MGDQFNPYQYLVTLAACFDGIDPEELAELRERISPTADYLITHVPFPITAATLYAMNYGVLLNYNFIEMTNPVISALQNVLGPAAELKPEDSFMALLCEVARRIIDGELPTPEFTA